MEFPCTKCGACCMSMGLILENKGKGVMFQKEVEEFPYKADENGVCEKLTDKGCSVYKDRPDLCNTETIRERYYSHLSKKDYFLLMIDGCKRLIKHFDVDESLTPKLDD